MIKGILVITADGGGSNGYRLRLWKLELELELELQKLANETCLSLQVCHFPPGTSKWNKIEHRLFSFISSNWRGEPLRDYETVVHLISRTRTAKGLKVSCRLDRRKYPTGRKVTDEEMRDVHLERKERKVRRGCDKRKEIALSTILHFLLFLRVLCDLCGEPLPNY